MLENRNSPPQVKQAAVQEEARVPATEDRDPDDAQETGVGRADEMRHLCVWKL